MYWSVGLTASPPTRDIALDCFGAVAILVCRISELAVTVIAFNGINLGLGGWRVIVRISYLVWQRLDNGL